MEITFQKKVEIVDRVWYIAELFAKNAKREHLDYFYYTAETFCHSLLVCGDVSKSAEKIKNIIDRMLSDGVDLRTIKKLTTFVEVSIEYSIYSLIESENYEHCHFLKQLENSLKNNHLSNVIEKK